MKRRVHYLVNKKMQLGFIVRFLLISLLFALFLGFEAYIATWPVIVEYLPESVLGLVKHQILFRAAFFLLPALFVTAAFSVVFSHRIAGPLYRIEKTLDELIRGENVRLIRLRKGDELQDLADKINKVISIIEGLKGPNSRKDDKDHPAS